MYLKQRRPSASSPIIIHEFASSESSVSPRVSEAALSSMYRVTGDQEQLEYPYRPMTPGEEEIMMIYEDGLRDQEVSRYSGSVSDQEVQQRKQLRMQ